MKIKIRKDSYGQYYAEYLNPADRFLNCIGQYENTAFEAELNLKALLNTIKKDRLKSNIFIWGT